MTPAKARVLCWVENGPIVGVGAVLHSDRCRSKRLFSRRSISGSSGAAFSVRRAEGKAQFVPFNNHYFLISCREARLRRREPTGGLSAATTLLFGILVGSQTRNVGFVFVRTISLV